MAWPEVQSYDRNMRRFTTAARPSRHLVLELAAAEFGADEVPDELHELDALARADRGRLIVALGIGAGLRARERGLRRTHGLKGAARSSRSVRIMSTISRRWSPMPA